MSLDHLGIFFHHLGIQGRFLTLPEEHCEAPKIGKYKTFLKDILLGYKIREVYGPKVDQ